MANGNIEICKKCGREITINMCSIHNTKDKCYFCHLAKRHVNAYVEEKDDKSKKNKTVADKKDETRKPKKSKKDSKDDDKGIYS